ncbi:MULTISPECIES: (2Fe-2S)-binding protein [unclassified Roseitalea]|uniref:(2Fe-2S)-binding protein n=1 Tax=unclassified Roseitalea TaxID=2639107 RepID=UPI00273F1951|nr:MULTISPECIES: (2Fe-2S)-binding protein [unclassified Roseitalea]
MIVCSCNVIARQQIEAVVTEFLERDEWQLITAGMVYHAMHKRGKCCSCFPRVIDVIVRVSEEFHRRRQTPEAEIVPFVARLRSEHERCETARALARERRLRRAA